jgi:serine protease Do
MPEGKPNMRRPFLLTGFVLLLFATVISPLKAAEDLSEVVSKVAPSVVVVLTYDESKNPVAQGSGFFISKNGDIITNAHVIKGAFYADIKTTDGEVYPVTGVVDDDSDGDLVRLSVDIQS